MLSAMMLKREVLDVVRDVLIVEDFFSFQHRAVYEAILELDAASKPFDVVTVRYRLEAAGRLQQLGGSAFLSNLVDATPAVANVVEHARLVHDLGLLRRMKDTLERLALAARLGETRADVQGFLERCEGEVFHANAAESDRDSSSGIDEMMALAVTELTTPAAQAPRGVTTGLIALDEISLGLVPGELWYVAGRPGMGKTALALGFAETVASTGRGAVVFSMEMKRHELSERMLSASSGVDSKLIHKRALSDAQLTEVIGAATKLGAYPIRLDDTAALTASTLRSRIRRHVAAIRAKTSTAHLALVVVDYVQLMSVERKSGSRNEDLEDISRTLKILAGEFECTIVALSQLKRPDPRSPVTRPSLSDLRGSGALEQDANKVLFIHRAPDDDPNARGEAELILAKGRNTGPGKARVTWLPWCVRFQDREQGAFAYSGVTDGPPLFDDEA